MLVLLRVRNWQLFANLMVQIHSCLGLLVSSESISLNRELIKWIFLSILFIVLGNLTISNSTDRFILKANENKVQNAILMVENASLDDRGEYKCIGHNAAMEYTNMEPAKDVSYVRVKGKKEDCCHVSWVMNWNVPLMILMLCFLFCFLFWVICVGKLAALWPFLGICAEVLILCIIILIYEKRRNKCELEESDTDPQEQ